MKKAFIAIVALGAACMAGAEVVYTYTGQGTAFDGNTNRVEVLLNDNGIPVTMTVAAAGGNPKSLTSDFGIGSNTRIDGTGEALTISFDKAVDFVSIDLKNVGSAITNGASLKIGNLPVVDLFTGTAGFNGSSDVYIPAAPIRLNAGETIVLTGSAVTSSFGLEKMTLAAVPEPATVALTGVGGLLAWLIRRAAAV